MTTLTIWQQKHATHGPKSIRHTGPNSRSALKVLAGASADVSIMKFVIAALPLIFSHIGSTDSIGQTHRSTPLTFWALKPHCAKYDRTWLCGLKNFDAGGYLLTIGKLDLTLIA